QQEDERTERANRHTRRISRSRRAYHAAMHDVAHGPPPLKSWSHRCNVLTLACLSTHLRLFDQGGYMKGRILAALALLAVAVIATAGVATAAAPPGKSD